MYRTLTIAAVTALLAGFMTAQPTVTSVSPSRNGGSESTTANMTAGFSENMKAANSSTFVVNGKLRGKLAGTYSGANTQSLSFNPTTDLAAGEEVEVTLTTGLQNTSNVAMAAGHVFRYRAKAGVGPAVFDRVFAATGQGNGWDSEFGDLDGDGDMDMVSVDWRNCSIHTNDGSGTFTTTSFGVGDEGAYGCAIADMDGDGDLDIIISCAPGSTSTGQVFGQNKVFLNNGSGGFANSVNFGASDSRTIDLDIGDIDGDGDLDIVTANGDIGNYENFIYINNGNASFTTKHFLWVPNTTAYVQDNTWCVRLADADNDGDLDVYFGNFGFTGGVDSYLYLNDGNANFDKQRSTTFATGTSILSLAVADFDDDGDNDIAIGTLGQTSSGLYTNYIYWNQGSSYSAMAWSSAGEAVWGLEPADVDGDGDLDLAVLLESANSWVFLNSAGGFGGSVTLGKSAHNAAFADIDGDGDLDCGMPDRIATNGTNPPALNVKVGGNWLSDNDTVNVAYNATLASQNINIVVSDSDNDDVAVTTTITNVTSQGFLNTEWNRTSAAVSYSLTPSTGTFNQGSSLNIVTITAVDAGGEVSVFRFKFLSAAAPNSPPVFTVIGNSAIVTNGGNLFAAFGSNLSALGLSISVNDIESVSIVGNVSLKGSTGILDSEFSAASASTPYSLSPYTGVFNTGAITHVVTLTADDGNGGSAQFIVNIIVGAQPQPLFEAFENSVGGTQISNGSGATGARDFGSIDINAGASSLLTVVINNPGTSAMAVSSVTIGGSGAAEFLLDTTGMNSSIPANDSTSFALNFNPSTIGGKTATITIIHDGTNVSTPFTFDVSGVATTIVTAPIIVVREGSLSGIQIANGSAAAGGRIFGSFAIGDASTPLTIVIQNSGNTDLILGTPTISGSSAFSIDTTIFNPVVPANSSTSFSVKFTPGTTGSVLGTVIFTHNDTSTVSPYSFGVSGEGTVMGGIGSTSGSGSTSGGGCAAGGDTTSMLFFLLLILGGVAVFRTRMNREVA